eukprot:43199-Eustigmatos_ZCMA.PRE.1
MCKRNSWKAVQRSNVHRPAAARLPPACRLGCRGHQMLDARSACCRASELSLRIRSYRQLNDGA